MARRRPNNTRTKRREGSKHKGQAGVTKVNAKPTPKRKETIKQGGPQKGKKGIKELSKQRQAENADIDTVDSKVETTSSESHDSGIASPLYLTTPVLKRNINIADDGDRRFIVHDMASMGPELLIVVSVKGSIKAINPKKYIILSQLKLPERPDVSVVYDNTIVVFSGSSHLDFVVVLPKLKITKAMKLEQDYQHVRATYNGMLLGIRVRDYDSSFDFMDTSGKRLRTFRPKILKGLSLQYPQHLFVNRQEQIVVIDGKMDLVICFPISGIGGFIYSGGVNNKYIGYKHIEMKKDMFQKTDFTLRSPSSMASDSKGNFYIADRDSGVVVKLDPNGNFVQNILPLKLVDFNRYHIAIHIDEKDHLYFTDNAYPSCSIKVYDLD